MPRIAFALLACAALRAGRASAQHLATTCTVSADTLREMVLQDGTFGIVFPVEMLARHDSILVLGTSGIKDESSRNSAMFTSSSSIREA